MGFGGDTPSYIHQGCNDEIARLRAEVARLTREREEWKAEYEQSDAYLAHVKVKALRALAAQLAGALRHYAKAESEWGERARAALAAAEKFKLGND